MYPVRDMFPCSIPQNTTAKATVPANVELTGLAAHRAADWAQAERSGRSGRRSFSRSV